MDRARSLRRKIPQRPQRQEKILESTIRWGSLGAAAIAIEGNLAHDAGKGSVAAQAPGVPRVYTHQR